MAGLLTHRMGAFNLAAGGGSDPDFASTKLLLGFEGADASTTITDESAAARGNATVFADAQIDTAQFKYGASSLLLDGTGDYLTFANHADFNFGSGAWTIEFFLRWNSVAAACFLGNHDAGGNSWRFRYTGTALVLDGDNGVGTTGITWSPSTATWYHLCVDREAAGSVRVYVDGSMLQKGGSANALDDSALALTIGRLPHTAAHFLNGWMDEIRITKGVARYASDGGFTVPAAAYPRS